MIRVFFPIILLSILFSTLGTEAGPQYDFQRITLADGLPNDVVYAVMQGRDGYLWLGTDGGLFRYDGYEFKEYRNQPTTNESARTLSENNISDLAQDQTGWIWIATWGGGLNGFNPHTEQFIHARFDENDPHSLSGDRVQSLFIDKFNNLWVGTYKSGLNRIKHEMLLTVIETFEKTGQNPVFQFSRFQADPNDPFSLSNNRIWSITEDQLGYIWLGTDAGLNRFDPGTESFLSFVNNPANPKTLGHNRVRSVFVDEQGTLWVGSQNSLNRFDHDTETFERYYIDFDTPGKNIITDIHEDHYGNLWVGTEQNGLAIFDKRKREFVLEFQYDPYNPRSISNNDIRRVIEDQSNLLWVATRGGGINKADLKPPKFYHIKHDPINPVGLSHHRVWAIWEDEAGLLWVGTDGGGLDIIERDAVGLDNLKAVSNFKSTPGNPQSLSNNRIRAIHIDSNKFLWVGTYENGLSRADLRQFPLAGQKLRRTHAEKNLVFDQIRPDPDDPAGLSHYRVYALREDRTRNLWVGTDNGLNRLNLARYGDAPPNKLKFDYFHHDPADNSTLSAGSILSIWIDRENYLWVGTKGGGLNKSSVPMTDDADLTPKFQHFVDDPQDANSLHGEDVQAIVEDTLQVMWIGTNLGLNRLDKKTNRFTCFVEKDGLPSNEIRGIQVDGEGFLWISTERGLSKFDPVNQTFRNYDAADGLQGNVFSDNACHKSRYNREVLYFGGINGINVFEPANVGDNQHLPKVVITRFKRNDEPIPIAQLENIRLSYKDYFEFEFAALDFTNPSKNRYSFQLVGIDQNWSSPSTRRSARYTNIDGGKFVFRVRGSNNDGKWDETGVAVNIRVTPPPWKSWWGYTLEIFFLIGLVLGIVYQQRQRVRRNMESRQRNSELERARALQLSLIPKQPPLIPSFKMAGYMKTAKEVGGDYYDFIYLDDAEKLYITIGDVSGKGIPASMLMVTVRTIFHTLALQNISTRDILIRTNEQIYPDLSQMKNPMFITLLLLAWDRAARKLYYTGAGHERILIYRQETGDVDSIKSGGVCLGIVDSIEYVLQEKTLSLDAGDTIILYTDGITEYINPAGDMFGLERLLNFVKVHGSKNPDEIISTLLKTLDEFGRNAAQIDDVTIVVLKKMPTDRDKDAPYEIRSSRHE